MKATIDSRMRQEHSGLLIIGVGEHFLAYIPAAVVRLGYLHPHLTFSWTPLGNVHVEGTFDHHDVRRDVLHAVYREKVLKETLPLRQKLIDGLLGR
jgi:hypothetical protein